MKMRAMTAAIVCLAAFAASSGRHACADVGAADGLRFAGKYKEALEKYGEVLDGEPDNGPALYGAAVCWTALGTPEAAPDTILKARPLLARLTSKYPKDPEYRFMYGYWAYVAAGKIPAEKEDLLKLAEAEVTAANELKSDDRFLEYVGRICRMRGRFAEAAMIFDVFLRKSPNNAEFHFLLGECRNGLGNEAQAVESYLAAFAANPNYTPAYEPLRKVFSRLRAEEKQDKAIELLRKIAALKTHPWVRGWVLWELGGNLTDIGDYPGAIDALKQAETACPDEAMFSNTLALNYLTIGEHDNAIASLKKASEKNPKLLYSWENLGHTQASLGRIAEAKDAFKKGLANAREVSEKSDRADLKAEAQLYLSLFRWYLDQLAENSK